MYAPLPQSVSDTESSEDEEEILNAIHFHGNQISNRKQATTVENFVGGTSVRKYTLLDKAEVSENGLASPVKVLPPNTDHLSCARKICFVFTLLLCLSVMVTFIWVLPCDLEVCQKLTGASHRKTWENTFKGIGITGGIHLIAKKGGAGYELVFGFYSRENTANSADGTEKLHGVAPFSAGLMSLRGDDGTELWRKTLLGEPHSINCSIIDTNQDGDKECLVVGSYGMMVALDPYTGSVIWYMHDHSGSAQVMALQKPLLVQDIDQDGVSELLTACALKLPPGEGKGQLPRQNHLVMVSGRTGQMIGKPLMLQECLSILELSINDRQEMVSYTCRGPTKEEEHHYVSLHDLIEAFNESLVGAVELVSYVRLADSHPHQLSHVALAQAGGYRIQVQNEGTCPNCSVLVQIVRSVGNITLWSFVENSAFAMSPVSFSFNYNGKSTLNCFVLKFWQWNVNKAEKKRFVKTLKEAASVYKAGKNDTVTEIPSQYNKEMGRGSAEIPESYIKPDVEGDSPTGSLYPKIHSTHNMNIPNEPSAHPDATSTSYMSGFPQTHGQVYLHEDTVYKGPEFFSQNVKKLTERVMLITFNETDFQVTNISLTRVTQLCSDKDARSGGHELCVPMPESVQESVVVADLDGDSSQDLVSFTSSYTLPNEDITTSKSSNGWYLQSVIRRVNLEAELPQLYTDLPQSYLENANWTR